MPPEVRAAMHLAPTDQVDLNSLIAGNGNISCTLVYDLVRHRGHVVLWGSLLWGGAQCKSWSFIVWLAAKNKLQTGKKLFEWGCTDSPVCVLCEEGIETVEHIWFQFNYTKVVANFVLNWIEIGTRWETIEEWLEWFGMEQLPRRKSIVCQCN